VGYPAPERIGRPYDGNLHEESKNIGETFAKPPFLPNFFVRLKF
jgi:hypothetical protein